MGSPPRTGPAGIDTRTGSHLGSAAQEPPGHRIRARRRPGADTSQPRHAREVPVATMGATTDSSNLPYRVVTNETGRVFRAGRRAEAQVGGGLTSQMIPR